MSTETGYAKALKKAMAETGIGATELAAKTGIPKSTISQYANGYMEPSPKRVAAINEALGVAVKQDAAREPAAVDDRPSMSVEDAARIMGKSAAFVREGLKQGRMPFGYAVEMPGGKWSFWIGRSKFTECTGLDAGGGTPAS